MGKQLSIYSFIILVFFCLLSCGISPKKEKIPEATGVNSLKKKELKVIGWREWVALPDMGIKKIKAKVDTGARTSSLHAFDLKIYTRGGQDFVKFKIHPEQRNAKGEKEFSTKVIEYRKVKSSNGQTEQRPVILTTFKLFGEEWESEITLTNRDEMGFRMLLGRESLKNRFLIHSGRSFLGEKAKQKKAKK